MLMPSSRFSKTAATGIRVPRNTQAPLTFPGTLSTAEHCDQSSVAMCDVLWSILSDHGQGGFVPGFRTGSPVVSRCGQTRLPCMFNVDPYVERYARGEMGKQSGGQDSAGDCQRGAANGRR